MSELSICKAKLIFTTIAKNIECSLTPYGHYCNILIDFWFYMGVYRYKKHVTLVHAGAGKDNSSIRAGR